MSAIRRRRRRRGELMAKDLVLTGYATTVAATAGTTVGSVTNKIASSTLTLIDDGGGRFVLAGLNLNTTSTPRTAGTYILTLKETNSMASQFTRLEIVVT